MLSPASFFFFFFNDTATTEIYTLSLHDALPIFQACWTGWSPWALRPSIVTMSLPAALLMNVTQLRAHGDRKSTRLNSSHGYISYAVFCLKKKKKNTITATFDRTTVF